jgi:hypothetical protein
MPSFVLNVTACRARVVSGHHAEGEVAEPQVEEGDVIAPEMMRPPIESSNPGVRINPRMPRPRNSTGPLRASTHESSGARIPQAEA